MTETQAGPLAGIRVVDLGRIAAGPFCAMLLGDLGAEVIRVETPGGDAMRDQLPGFTSGVGAYFTTVNRNKRAVMLDLRAPAGMRALRKLLATADVLIENFRPGVLEAMGLDPATLERDYPKLVVGRIAAYGHHGPKSQRPGVDQIIQAISGFMSVTGTPETGPIRAGFAVCDIYAGMACAFGVLAALYERRDSGRGQLVQTSLLQAILAVMSVQAGKYMATDQAPPPEGNHHPVIAPYGLFPTADGHIVIGVLRNAHFAAFAGLCGHPEWAEDERFADTAGRSANKDALRDLVTAAMPCRTTAEWLRLLEDADIPCGPVLSVKEAYEDPQARALGMTIETALSDGTPVRVPGVLAGLSRTPMALRRPPPLPAEHTAEVLAEIGLDGDPEVRKAAGLE
jgi:crotonobetainyl-CoA:carnitine CoA-transferase CaiB-like acyl-CoA transferase